MTAEEKQLAIKKYCNSRKYCTAYEDENLRHIKECPLLPEHGCAEPVFIDAKYEILEEFLKTEHEWTGAAVLKSASESLRKLGESFKKACEPFSEMSKETEPDLVHHPSHYCYSEYEPKDVIRAWGLNFNLGSAVKYIARAGRKDDILQELNKAKQFIEFEIEAIEKERAGDEK